MELDIIKIGNSQGIRIPIAILKQCGIDSKVSIEIKNDSIIIKPIEAPRRGWAENFQLMHKENDDMPIIHEEIDSDFLADWDDSND